MTVCGAFDKAKTDVSFKHKSAEADIFQIITPDDELALTPGSKSTVHKC